MTPKSLADPVIFSPLVMDGWPDDQPPAGDLGACYAIPDSAGLYLIAESGYYKWNFG